MRRLVLAIKGPLPGSAGILPAFIRKSRDRKKQAGCLRSRL